MAEKILIVDDDVETLRLVGLMLQRQGYQIAAANHGTQALTMATNESPDLIVLDVMMPDMDGYQVTRKIRSDPETSTIPILMFTAKSQVDDKVAGYEAGVDDYLTKPIHPAELVAHVRSLLQRSKSRGASPGERGYTIGVVSARGGLGVSTITLNLAIDYHNQYKTEVIGAELRPGSGTWGNDLGYANTEGLNTLLRMKPSDIAPSNIEKELFRTSYGVRLLMASPHGKDAELVGATHQMEALLQQLPLLASVCFLDIGTNLLPNISKVLGICNELLVIIEPYPATIQKTPLLLEELSALGFGKSKLLNMVLVNRTRADMQFTMTKIQESLGQNVSLLIPPVPELAFQAALSSVPMIHLQPEGIFAQQMHRLSEKIMQRATKR
jgi:CheY-like chemotaxis protein/MinD-like ATPase involved in chromosome partitioning or flagellar assembly